MDVIIMDRNCNELAICLVYHGGANYGKMVVIKEPFCRIFELWALDMGLGYVKPRFMEVHEDDLNTKVADGEHMPTADHASM